MGLVPECFNLTKENRHIITLLKDRTGGILKDNGTIMYLDNKEER